VPKLIVASRCRASRGPRGTGAGFILAAAVLGFFVITFDAVVVNVALPSIQRDLGGGITGLQWVVDGYMLMFAALLLSAGALSDRVGARGAFAAGVVSAACGLVPSLGALIVARFAQGAAAAVMMPSSMALTGQAYPDPVTHYTTATNLGRSEGVRRLRTRPRELRR
jgi:MFS family permease